jgi:hypothetical protein
MKRSILVALSVLILLGGVRIVNAELRGNNYLNKFVGLSFSVPRGWYVATDKEMMDLLPDAAKFMNNSESAVKPLISQLQGKILLMISERPFSSELQSANKNIIIVAFNIREISQEIRSGEDYLRLAAKGMKDRLSNVTIYDIVTRKLGNEEFHRLNVILRTQELPLYICQWAKGSDLPLTHVG